MEVQDGNKLIAGFDPLMKLDDTDPKGDSFVRGVGVWHHARNLQYHQSWDWLMPVVEKIHKIDLTAIAPDHDYPINKVRVEINYPNCYISAGGWYDWHEAGYEEQLINISSYNSRLEEGKNQLEGIGAVWYAVVQFIQWYNSPSGTISKQ